MKTVAGLLSFVVGILLAAWVSTSSFATNAENLADKQSLSLPEISISAIFVVLISLPLLAFSFLRQIRGEASWPNPLYTTIATFSYFGFVLALLAPFFSMFFGLVQDQWTQSERSNVLRAQNTESILYSSTAKAAEFSSFYGSSYEVAVYAIPGTYDYFSHGSKPSGFITQSNGMTFLVQGDGSVLGARTDDILQAKPSLELTSIPSNLSTLLDVEIQNPNWFSIKGAHSNEKQLWIASSQKVTNGSKSCWNTSIFVADLDGQTEFLNFSQFYSPGECPLKDTEFNAHQAGGFLLTVSGDLVAGDSNAEYLVFGHGDYRTRYLAQDVESAFGSIMAINTSQPEDVILLAKGVRNPQGAVIAGKYLYFVDQGPAGGDEVNKLQLGVNSSQNFGWPIASYGDHYRKQIKAEAPLLPSHEDFGFIEPSYFWNPSVAPSSIDMAQIKGENFFVVSSLGTKPSEGDESLLFFRDAKYSNDRLSLTDFINLGSRIRDIMVLDQTIVVYSDSGELMVVTQK